MYLEMSSRLAGTKMRIDYAARNSLVGTTNRNRERTAAQAEFGSFLEYPGRNRSVLGFYALDDLTRTQATADGRSGPTVELKLRRHKPFTLEHHGR